MGVMRVEQTGRAPCCGLIMSGSSVPTSRLVPLFNTPSSQMDPKALHVELQPFLEKNTGLFMRELWSMLHSASGNESGVPQQLLDAKAEELREKREKEMAIQVGWRLVVGEGAMDTNI